MACNICLQQFGKHYESYLLRTLTPKKIPFYSKGSLGSVLYSRNFIRPLNYEVCTCVKYNPRGIGITISPSPDTVSTDQQVYSFINKVTKFFIRPWILEYDYVFEWTKNNVIHVHAFIVTKSKLPSYVRYELKRTFKCNYKVSWSQRINTIAYISKNKLTDIDLRKKYNLENIYTNGISTQIS